MRRFEKLCLAILLSPIVFANRLASNAPLTEDNKGVFVTEFKDKDSYIKHGVELNGKLADEGFTLLKNDGTLPLKKGAKVSLCGKSSTYGMVRGGNGSGAASVAIGIKSIDIVRSLETVGFEVNPELVSFYNDNNRSGSGRTHGSDSWTGNSEFKVGETPWSSYDENLIASFNQYHDVGIQVIARDGFEGCDIKTIDTTDLDKFGFSNKHALELSDNEQALYDHLHKLVDKIIIIVNSSNPFECDQFMKDDKVAGILWIGNPGDVGPGAIGRILSGEVNPSGHLVDTWARDFTKDPTFQNFGDNRQHGNAIPDAVKFKHQSLDTMFASDGAPMMSFGTDIKYTNHLNPRWFDAENYIVSGGLNGVRPASYVSYEEGIYVDYRYYETRYQDILEKEGKEAADAWYNGVEGVTFPFGYGLSYTSFSQEIVRINPRKNSKLDSSNDIIEVSVKVTNTGNVAGKDSVQIYWKTPYFEHEIEKADHVLCAFDKTKELAPGESQTLHLSFHLQDVANYDYSDANNNGFKGYELDAGKYSILLNKNAHETYDSVDFEVKDNGIQYSKDRFTGSDVQNRFTDRGFHSSTPGKDDVEFTEMSRSGFESTFPHFPSLEDRTVKPGSKFEEFLTHEFNIWDIEEDGDYSLFPKEMIISEEEAKTRGFKQSNNVLSKQERIQFASLRGVKYDDPLWKEFIDQMTWSELIKFVESFRMMSPQNSEIGKDRAQEGDGPQKFSFLWWVSSPIIAATFNPRLASEQGKCVANEAHISGKSGWWGPNINIHRSPFGGRNFECYSADPFLTGRIASEITSVAVNRGVAIQMKNFGIYNQEKNREGLCVFVNEQAIREIYLKGFQMVVTQGKVTGFMGSYNRIGLIDSAASYPLNTEILRNEWGFRGSILSEMTHSGNASINFKCYENVTARVLSGQNCQLDSVGFQGQTISVWDENQTWSGGTGAPVYERDGVKHISFTWWNAVREAVKGHMYMFANSILADKEVALVDHNFTKTVEACETFKINVKEDVLDLTSGKDYKDFSVLSSSFRVNNNTPLPNGVTFKDGIIEGSIERIGITRFEILFDLVIETVALEYEIEVVPNMAITGLEDVTNTPTSISPIVIGVASVAALAVVAGATFLFIRRRKA